MGIGESTAMPREAGATAPQPAYTTAGVLRRWQQATSELIDWLTPKLTDRDDLLRARFCVQGWLIAWPLALMWAVIYGLTTDIVGQVALNGLALAVGPVVLWNLRRDGRWRLWTHVSLSMGLLLWGLGILAQTPIDETNLCFLLTVPLLASFAFDQRDSARWAVLTALLAVLVLVAGNSGYSLPGHDPSPLLSKCLNTAFALLLIWAFAHRFDRLRVEARRRIEEASRAKSVFLAAISHEIRTPMNGVLGMTELMLDEVQDPHQREQLLVVQRSGEVMVALINDLLDLTKLEERKLTLECVPVSLDALLGDLTHLYSAVAHGKGLDLQVRRAPDAPSHVQGDPVRLQQLLGNLISNALKFTLQGGVCVDVSREHGADREGWLRFAVRDTGIGIAPESLPRLFDLFEQAEASTARRFGGSGLGLPLAQQLAERMGGVVEAESTPGVGSCFSAVLPLLAAPVAAKKAPKTDEKPSSPFVDLPVLVVDDNPVNLMVIARLVEKAGGRPTRASSGAEALNLIQTHDFALVLMDCHMPEMDGFEVVRRIRALPGPRGKVPVFAVTASAAPDDLQACFDAGMDQVLSKPLALSALRPALAAAAGLAQTAPAPSPA